MPLIAERHRTGWGDSRGTKAVPLLDEAAELDQAHPLSNGLQHCVLFQNGPPFQNYGSPFNPATSTDSHTLSAITQRGVGFGWNNYVGSSLTMPGTQLWAVPPCSLIGLFQLVYLVGNNNSVVFEKNNGSSEANSEVDLVLTNTGNVFAITFGGSLYHPSSAQYTVDGVAGGALSLGSVYHFALTIDPAGNAAIYFDAVPGASTLSVTTTGYTSTGATWNIVNSNLSAAAIAGAYMIGFWTWTRQLTAREVLHHYYDPVTMLRPSFVAMRAPPTTVSQSAPLIVPPQQRIIREGVNIYAPFI